MDFPQGLSAQLAELSQALADDGTDLQAILEVLGDDLAAAVPSYLGLTLTMYSGGIPVTFTTVDAGSSGDVRASFLIPLSLIIPTDPRARVIFFAAVPGAFDRLAADTRQAYGLDGELKLDNNLAAQIAELQVRLVAAGVDAFTHINQAIGVLIAQGFTAAEASADLRRRALDDDRTLHQTAQRVLGELS